MRASHGLNRIQLDLGNLWKPPIEGSGSLVQRILSSAGCSAPKEQIFLTFTILTGAAINKHIYTEDVG
jgi:hypothetical protein